jgi:hypothetical protein
MYGESSIQRSGNTHSGIRNDVDPSGSDADIVMREKKCGWRIDIFYANEHLMEDVLSSEILDSVFLVVRCKLTEDYGLRPLPDHIDFEGYHFNVISYSSRSRKYQKSHQATRTSRN